MYRIKHSQFCAISKERNFQLWLANINPNYYEELIEHLKTSSGCRSNAKKMAEIEQKITDDGKRKSLIEFLSKYYPLCLDSIDNKSDEVLPDDTVVEYNHYDSSIFKHYNPLLLSFPQKIIFRNSNAAVLESYVKEFLINKISYDYIIVNDKAYVEYFHSKYSEESKLISRESRDLFKYRERMKNGKGN